MKPSTLRTEPLTPKKRCAIYTRKSTEEGLEQEYNSLEAQRDAALAFITSQRHEGWLALADEYNDGGYSGGNLERPAIQRLLADIQRGRVDVVVVYKIDRLSRSLADFARMVDLFDQHGVTFVSVTQQFNTTTSMGRLTLNILLSFAQFEREVTGERIRDKIAASKAKGMWMGGNPPLGYDVKDRKLIVNEREADLVRDIFRRFAQHGSCAQLVRELQIEGHTTKSWVTQNGNFRPGRMIDQQFIAKLLRNRTYLGEIVHKGVVHPGQHEAIIDQALWDTVHAILERRKVGPRVTRAPDPALLAGLLFAADGQRMLPTHTVKPNGKRYHYYLPYSDAKHGVGTKGAGRGKTSGKLPAAEVDAAVLQQIHKALQQPEIIIAVLRAAQAFPHGADLDEATVVVAMRRIGHVWDQLFPAEQHRIAKLLIERVQLHADGLDIVWKAQGWQGFGDEVTGHVFVKEQREWETEAK